MIKGEDYTHTRILSEDNQSHKYYYWFKQIVAIKRLK